MKKRAWVSVRIETEIEWEVTHDKDGEKDDLGYIPAIKEKLALAKIAEFNGTELEEKTIEYKCEECGEWKPAHCFYKKPKQDMCIDCEDYEPTDEEKREEYGHFQAEYRKENGE